MEKLQKNDQVKIINTNDFWEDKKAIVISQFDEQIFDDENLDITPVKVKIDFGEDKSIIQEFPRYCLELQTKNETLNETIVSETLDLNLEEDFKKFFIGKECKFNGFDYKKLFKKVEQKDGTLDFTQEDKEYIAYYKELEKLPCKITSCALIDSFNRLETAKENFTSAYWNIEFENGDILNAISGEDLTLITVKFESLTEKLEKQINDYIKDYVYAETLDDIIPSWFFVDKLAAVENLENEVVLRDAKKLHYTIYRITAPYFDKFVIAAPKCTKKTIYDDYADYLQGPVDIKEV